MTYACDSGECKYCALCAAYAEIDQLKHDLAGARKNHIDANERNMKACEDADRLAKALRNWLAASGALEGNPAADSPAEAEARLALKLHEEMA